jgi:hypothetical protein
VGKGDGCAVGSLAVQSAVQAAMRHRIARHPLPEQTQRLLLAPCIVTVDHVMVARFEGVPGCEGRRIRHSFDFQVVRDHQTP